MKIVIGNLKGGVGKSRITILLANYLAIHKKKTLGVLDVDSEQYTIYSIWDKYKDQFDEPVPYEVLPTTISDVQDFVSRPSSEIAIFDMPGNMKDEELWPIYKACDILITPYVYDEEVIDSTIIFCEFLKDSVTKDNWFFLPNMVRSSVKYQLKHQVNELLEDYGSVLPEMKQLERFKVNCNYLPANLIPTLDVIFAPIMKKIEAHDSQK